MAGCECGNWKAAIRLIIVGQHDDGYAWSFYSNDKPRVTITYCPWCGSKLTEEAGDENI